MADGDSFTVNGIITTYYHTQIGRAACFTVSKDPISGNDSI